MATTTAPRHSARTLTAGGLTAVLLLSLAGCGGATRQNTASAGGGRSGGPGAAGAAKVPEATTFTTISGAPRDGAPDDTTDGLVAHPATAAAVFDRPGGRRIATLPTTELGGPTWVPVVESSGDWRRVLLPSRPNQASGWVSAAGLKTAHSPYTVRVELAQRRLTLRRSERTVGRWKVAVGGAKTPTPPGRTFVMANLAPPRRRRARPSCRSAPTRRPSTPSAGVPAPSRCTAGPTPRCSARRSRTAASGYPRTR